MEHNQPYSSGNSLPPQPAPHGQQPLPSSRNTSYAGRLGGYAVSGYAAAQQSQPTTQQPARPNGSLGRISRLGFLLGWVYMVGIILAHLALVVVVSLIGMILPDVPARALSVVFNIVNALLNLGEIGMILVVGTMLVIRRLHDLNLSGWAALLYFVPLVGAFMMLYLFFAPGKEPNKYGPPFTSRNFWVVLDFRKS